MAKLRCFCFTLYSMHSLEHVLFTDGYGFSAAFKHCLQINITFVWLYNNTLCLFRNECSALVSLQTCPIEGYCNREVEIYMQIDCNAEGVTTQLNADSCNWIRLLTSENDHKDLSKTSLILVYQSNVFFVFFLCVDWITRDIGIISNRPCFNSGNISFGLGL